MLSPVIDCPERKRTDPTTANDEVTPQLIDDTLALYPRIGFPAAFQAALAEVVRKKPILAAGTGLVDIGHRHVPGFALPNGCDLLDNTVFEHRH